MASGCRVSRTGCTSDPGVTIKYVIYYMNHVVGKVIRPPYRYSIVEPHVAKKVIRIANVTLQPSE